MAAARYTDGRSARVQSVEIEAGAAGLAVKAEGASFLWPWGKLRRADDFVAEPVLRREPDAGERLTLSPEAAAVVRTAAPELFQRPRTRWRLTAALGVAAYGLAAFFLIGVPMMAGPIAGVAPPGYVKRLDDAAWAQAQVITHECRQVAEGETALSRLLARLAAHARLDQDVNVMIRRASFANAFALPGGTIIVTDKLIALAERPDEIAGVLAHELAHIERKHNLANVIRHLGLGAFADIVLGGGGAGQSLAAASLNLAALRYNRDEEAEADRLAVAYLDRAGLDPSGLAQFFDHLGRVEAAAGVNMPEFISSHPDIRRRADTVRGHARPGRAPALTGEEWAAVRAACGGAPTTPTPGGKTP